MTAWFRRGGPRPGPPDPPSAPLGGGSDPDDRPEALLLRQWGVVQLVNRSAGRLPIEAVVLARGITDTVREVIETAGDGELDISAVIALTGIVDDYLPTTLRSYLALDPALTDRPGPTGRTPRQALREQLEALSSAADDLLDASRSHDVDALFTQGNFLRTKFSRSDLDL